MSGVQVRNLSFSYKSPLHQGCGNKEVLSGLNFSLMPGETVGIIGANGVGKSTLLKLLVGLETGYQGSIEVSGIAVQKKNLIPLRQKIGYVFQNSDNQLFMPTVYEDTAFGPKNYGHDAEEVEKRSLKALEMVHLSHLKNAPVYKLSGGQKKLTALATILSLNPDIILTDEPSVGLDPKNRRNLIQILNKLNTLTVIASHDLDLIYDTCTRTIILAKGTIVANGETKEILTNKDLLEENGLELPLSFSRHRRSTLNI